MPISERTSLDQVITGCEDIFTKKKKMVKKTRHFDNNILYKLKIYKMKVSIT